MESGAALGVASLVIQLLGGCIQGFVLLSEAHNIGRVGSSLVCSLSIQELRLTEWAKRTGLLSPAGVLDVRLNTIAVQSILTHLKDLLGDTEHLSKRYGMKLSVNRPPGAQEQDPLGPARVLGIPLSDEVRKDILWRAKLTQSRNSLPKRLWWAAVDREKFKDLVADVRVYVQDLWSLLDPVIQDDMLHTQQLTLAKVISLANNLEELDTLRIVLTNEPNELQNGKSLMPLGDIAAVKLERLTSSASDHHILPNPTHQLPNPTFVRTEDVEEISERELLDFTPMYDRIDMGLASYKSRAALVEWKILPSENRWKLIKRVQHLAGVLHVPKPISFRTLQCIGLCMNDEASKAGLVFQSPLPSAHAVSLREMLGGKRSPSAPSVTARMQLALELLRSIQYFHIAGWMHKNLRSENILFFRDEANDQPKGSATELGQSVIVGFTFARLDRPGEISEKPSTDPARDIYRHPHALAGIAENYAPFMDLYSIGMILVELAEWRPLSTLVRDVVDVKQDSVTLTQLSSVRKFVCQAACDATGPIKLEFRMGRTYARATRLCLGAETLAGEQVPLGRMMTLPPNEAYDVLERAIQELRVCVT